MDTTPTGTTPLTTDGAPVATEETAEVIKARLIIAEKERDDAKADALRANRAVEAGKKFEKFEEFQTAVLGKIETLEKSLETKDKELGDLRTILSGKAAITPDYTTTPAPAPVVETTTDEENRTRNILGLPIKK